MTVKHKLTDNFVRSVAVDKRTILWDLEIAGFGLRVSPEGAKAFILQKRIGGGNPRKWTLGKADAADGISAKDARAKALSYIAAIREGLDPEAEVKDRKGAPIMAEVIEAFFEHRKARRVANEQSIVRTYILPTFGDERAMDVTQRQVARLHHQIGEKAGAKGKPAPYQANRMLSLLSKVFNWAQDQAWTGVKQNPTKGIEHFDEDQVERYLSEAELERFIAVVEDWPDRALGNIIKLLLFTGARKSEVIEANLDQFDGLEGGGRVFWVKAASTTKQKKTHRVPLSPAAVEVILEQAKQASSDGRLFPGNTKSGYKTWQSKIWKRILKKAGIEGFRLHDIRHTYASLLASSGSELFMIGKLLGHSNTSTTQRYAHLTDDAMAEATDNVVNLFKRPA